MRYTNDIYTVSMVVQKQTNIWGNKQLDRTGEGKKSFAANHKKISEIFMEYLVELLKMHQLRINVSQEYSSEITSSDLKRFHVNKRLDQNREIQRLL